MAPPFPANRARRSFQRRGHRAGTVALERHGHDDPATAVEGVIGGAGGGGPGGGGTLHRGGSGKASRSIEEIKLVFDRNKGSIYTLYNRALREDPTLQGKLVVKLTISASGQVVECQLVSSELRSSELERKLRARIRQFDFGAKSVEVMVVTDPSDFLPS